MAITLNAQTSATASLEIRFHDYRNHPIEGVSVYLENQNSKDTTYFTSSNSEGIVRISRITPGTYIVSAKKDGYLPINQWIKLSRNHTLIWQLEENAEHKAKRKGKESLATPTPEHSQKTIPAIIKKYIKIVSQRPKLCDLPDNDRIRFTGYCKNDSDGHTPVQTHRVQSIKLFCSTSDYHGVIQSVYEKLKEGVMPDSIQFPADSRMTSYWCCLRCSDNTKYTGILLISQDYYDDWYVEPRCHYVLLDNKGQIKWEMAFEVSEGSNFPNDKVKYSNEFLVSNNGHTLILNAKKNLYAAQKDYKPGWMLFSNTGKLIADSQTPCCYPLILNSNKRFIIQQQTSSEEPATAAYNFKGELIWIDKNIRPFDTGYWKSPSENKIIGQLSGGMCIFNPEGNISSSMTGYPAENSDFNMDNPIWMREESFLIVYRSIMQLNFFPVTSFRRIMENYKTDYGLLTIQTIVPMCEDSYICAGFRSTGMGRQFHPESQYKFVGLLDDKFELTGIRFFTTPTGNDKTLDVKTVPFKSEFLIRTGHETITGRITSHDSKNKETVFPDTLTPEPTWTPRPTMTPAPRGYAGRVNWGDDTYWGFNNGVSVSVTDPDLNADPHQIEYCIVHVNSDSDTEGFDVVLREKNENSTVFFNILGYNSLRFTTGASVEGRCLHVEDGDEITVVYEEQSPKRLRKDTAVWHALEYNPPPSESDLCK